MIKCNIIIDGNYLLYKNLFILKKLRAISDLKQLLHKDYENLTKSFSYENIYFVSDSKEANWRKMVYPEYKSSRKKDIDIDWAFVYKTYTEFKEEIKNKPKLKLLEYIGLEGDDFIAHIIKTSNLDNFSNIVIASDGDLQQLLTFSLNNNFINIQWNYRFSDQRLYLPENYQLFLDKLNKAENNNIFALSNDNDFYQFIESLIHKTKIKTILPEQIIFEKIVQGDNSDFIKSVIRLKNGVYDETGRGIGGAGAATLYKLYKEINPEQLDIHSEIFVDKLLSAILYYKKIKSASSILKEKVKENILFNRMLITLDKQYMPEKIYNSMEIYYNDINSRESEYIFENLEDKLEEEGYFNGITEDIDEQFRIDEIDKKYSSSETFDPESFWEI